MAGRMGAVGAKPAAAGGASVLMPYRLDWPAWGAADAVNGMTFTRYQDPQLLGGGLGYQGGPANSNAGDWMEYLFDVDAGTYTKIGRAHV